MSTESIIRAAAHTRAAARVAEALRAFQGIIASPQGPDAVPVGYTPTPALRDNHRYRIESVSADRFGEDAAFVDARENALPGLDVLLLSVSPHWEDRIRAAALRETRADRITLPAGFPCIYEPADSPRNTDHVYAKAHAWVISPDVDMLHELLPLYQELWTAYEDQWPHTHNRSFTVGTLDNLSPLSVYRPGTTPAEVIGTTMLTHQDMYRIAPEHLRAMHPLHEQWTATRAPMPASTA
jgi:hypothetical protein